MDFQHNYRQQQQEINGGLTRYRSAPSSLLNSFLDNITDTISSSGGAAAADYGVDDLDHFVNKFMPNNHINAQIQGSPCDSLSDSMNMRSQSQFAASMKQEPETIQPQQLQQQNSQNDYSSIPEMMYQNQAQVQVQAQVHHSPEVSNASSMEHSYRLLSSMNSNQMKPMKMGSGGGNSNLIRYSSAPAGLFANINIENEYGAMRAMGNFGAGNNANAEASFSSASRFKGFSSGQTSSNLMYPISEIETTKRMGESNTSDISFREGNRNDGDYITGYPFSSWDDPAILSDNLSKGLGENDNKTFSNVVASENQNIEGQNDPPTLLSRHFSLPKTSAELSAMETLVQDSVFCKLRAKRGCATHPRSIAERVRRTKISDRMRKLQELVPNMDKQTSTSDMLDLAVDYIRDLQTQVKTLSDNRTKCTCSDQ